MPGRPWGLEQPRQDLQRLVDERCSPLKKCCFFWLIGYPLDGSKA